MEINFKERENNLKKNLIISEFLSNPNPFPRNPVCTKDSLPKFCLGRNEEIGIIKNAIERVSSSYNNKSAWIQINGSGGTGKSTIALYVYDSAKHKHSRDLDVDYLESSYIECPSDPQFLKISTIYGKILEDLGTAPGSFPYFIGYKFIKKLCEFFEQENKVKDIFLKKFSFVRELLSNSSNHSEFLLNVKRKAPNFAKELKNFVKDYDFILFENENVKLDIDYVEFLIDLISSNTENRRNSHDKIMGKDIENEDQAIKMLENLISVLNFLFKQNCLLIILDNMENLPINTQSSKNLFRMLLKFRNSINNCLLITIGSTDFWREFNNTLNISEINMLSGFKFEEISLLNLSETDASRIMNRYLQDFWITIPQNCRPIGADNKFPFSSEAFRYIYEINGRNLRETLKKLNRIVEEYKIKDKINYLKDIRDAIFIFRPKTKEVYLFENEMHFLEEFLSSYSDRNNLSRIIEKGIFTALTEIKNSSPIGKKIYSVKHEPEIRIQSGKIAKPDIFLKLFGDESVQNIKNVEISVKAYYPSSLVRSKEIEGSKALINEKKADYLTFLSLSPLEDKILEELKDFGPQIGRITKLSQEEACYLMLLTKDFSLLFFGTEILDFNIYSQILQKIDFDIDKLIDKVKNIKIDRKTKIEITKPVKPKPIRIKRPKTPEEKISNPTKLEPFIIKLLKERGLISTKPKIIEEMRAQASSDNVINNAISNLKQKMKIRYSRKSPQGWSLID